MRLVAIISILVLSLNLQAARSDGFTDLSGDENISSDDSKAEKSESSKPSEKKSSKNKASADESDSDEKGSTRATKKSSESFSTQESDDDVPVLKKTGLKKPETFSGEVAAVRENDGTEVVLKNVDKTFYIPADSSHNELMDQFVSAQKNGKKISFTVDSYGYISQVVPNAKPAAPAATIVNPTEYIYIPVQSK